MEPAKIDWKRISSILVVDDLYENINAPKFVDLSAPDEPVDDEAWFCRPDCNHPKTVEDFLKSTPLSKLQRSATASEVLPQRDRNTRDAYLKRRGLTQPSDLPNKDSNCDRFVEDGENQHPNLCATPSHHYNIMKAEIKSSTERKQIANPTKKEETPRLRSTLSARNLFGGRDLMNHITEFCNELKRLASRATERENVEKSDGKKLERKECDNGSNLGEMDEREKERKPLLEVSKENCEPAQKNNLKEKQRMKKRVEIENNPSPLELKIGKRKEGENLLQIRTNPPSPQCFSASRGPDKAAPLKASRSKPQERGILQELEQGNTELMKETTADTKSTGGKSASIVAEREARTLDVFWFLKPCTLSS
ncbi:hypothetical protein RHSIM_Rhsim07G0055100 [Rhododendron simsii]|uniref:Uncharacterized protein n=1 Tax=Rhododendron simsii TaxID=118357 RepID=A0A834GPL5_RHOSS|nr:hypothetical protein RHSIM_Rhsim07G0055100 [Rhododendron simsii]